ncbi:MAG: ABC transporter permease [Candidatus Syntrophonatronum acetioxidans]|uniref:ABC transporter permease n=1 Tax=Candidatus Syntrophonatronum acetioxidans TaxID=1795816 RepID=A0A424YIG0_9FIRM|nr:MAG: ABC transporter permease [Candidatus Syntrophonatronum acetioxidans]
MYSFFSRRIFQAIIVLIGVSLLTFVMMNLAPGDPYHLDPELRFNPEAVAKWKELRQLDQPLHVQYFSWLRNILKGDFGISLVHNKPVWDLMMERLPATLLLTGTSLLISLFISIPLGVFSAFRKGGFWDQFISSLTLGGVSMPGFWLGMLLILFFSYHFKWLPAAGMRTVGMGFSLLDYLRHLILPVMVLSVASSAYFIRYVRAGVGEVIQQDYIITAWAKGLGDMTILFRHILKNAILPLITVVSLHLPYLFTGAMLTEYVFSWPGMGRWIVSATMSRDYPSIMAVNVVVAILVTFFNLAADLLYAYLDPRIKYR